MRQMIKPGRGVSFETMEDGTLGLFVNLAGERKLSGTGKTESVAYGRIVMDNGLEVKITAEYPTEMGLKMRQERKAARKLVQGK